MIENTAFLLLPCGFLSGLASALALLMQVRVFVPWAGQPDVCWSLHVLFDVCSMSVFA